MSALLNALSHPAGRPQERLAAVEKALASGGDASSPIALLAWAGALACPSDGAVLEALERAGQDCARSMAASPRGEEHPLFAAAAAVNLGKVQMLMGRVGSPADLSPLVECWMREERALGTRGLELFGQALEAGAQVSEEAIQESLRVSEDTERLLALVSAGRLDPNRSVSLGQSFPMTLSQWLVLSSSTVRVDAWVNAGGDLRSPLHNGQTVAGRLMAEIQRVVPHEDVVRFEHFRLHSLRVLVAVLGGLPWHAPDQGGRTPWEHFQALPLDLSHPKVSAWAEEMRAQARFQGLQEKVRLGWRSFSPRIRL